MGDEKATRAAFDAYYEIRKRLLVAVKAKPMCHSLTGRLMPAQADAIDRTLPEGYRVDREHDVLSTGTLIAKATAAPGIVCEVGFAKDPLEDPCST